MYFVFEEIKVVIRPVLNTKTKYNNTLMQRIFTTENDKFCVFWR